MWAAIRLQKFVKSLPNGWGDGEKLGYICCARQRKGKPGLCLCIINKPDQAIGKVS